MFYRHDFIFWAGDLNYRLTEKYVPSRNAYFVPSDFSYQLIKNNEQLHLAIEQNKAFNQFQEQAITFPPTYKFNQPF